MRCGDAFGMRAVKEGKRPVWCARARRVGVRRKRLIAAGSPPPCICHAGRRGDATGPTATSASTRQTGACCHCPPTSSAAARKTPSCCKGASGIWQRARHRPRSTRPLIPCDAHGHPRRRCPAGPSGAQRRTLRAWSKSGSQQGSYPQSPWERRRSHRRKLAPFARVAVAATTTTTRMNWWLPHRSLGMYAALGKACARAGRQRPPAAQTRRR